MIEVYEAASGELKQGVNLAELKELWDRGGWLWVNLRAPEDEEVEAVLRGILGLHPLVVEDCRHASRFPKADVFEDYGFAVLLSPRTTVPRGAEFFMRELDLVVMKRALITVQQDELQAVQKLRDSFSGAGAQDLLGNGSALILHRLLDTLVDRYLVAAQGIEERSRELEEELGGRKRNRELLELILDLTLSGAALERVIERSRRVLGRLRSGALGDLLGKEAGPLFADLDDHLLRAMNLIEVATDRLRGLKSLSRANDAARQESILSALLGLQILTLVLLALALIVPGMAASVVGWPRFLAGALVVIGALLTGLLSLRRS